MLTDLGFIEITVGPAVDTFEGTNGEPNARAFDVYGHTFTAHKPPAVTGNPT